MCFSFSMRVFRSFLFFSSSLLFILVASEATKPLNHLPNSNDAQPDQHQQQHHSPLVQQERDHQPVELGDAGKAPPETAPIVQNGKQSKKGRESESGFGEGGEIVQSSVHPESNRGGSKVRDGGNRKRHGLGKTSARRTSSRSRKQDVLTEKPARLEEPADLNEVIFLDALSKNSGVTNSG